MSLAFRETEAGLLLAEHAADERTITAALKALDRSLCLQYREPYYVVVRRVADDYAPVICTWMDGQQRPLPLSSGLVEEVKRLHVGARNKGPSVDEQNAVRAAALERQREAENEAILADHAPILERGRVQVSFAYRNRKRDWMKKQKGRPR